MAAITNGGNQVGLPCRFDRVNISMQHCLKPIITSSNARGDSKQSRESQLLLMGLTKHGSDHLLLHKNSHHCGITQFLKPSCSSF